MTAPRRLFRQTFRCVLNRNRPVVLARHGASPGYIARHGGRASVDLMIAAIENLDGVWRRPSVTPSRYSSGTFPVLYTATREAVAIAERTHWAIELVFKPAPTFTAVQKLYLYRCEVLGSYRDHMRGWRRDKRIVHPTDYSHCHGLAQEAKRSNFSYIVVPSARLLGGCCVPVFDPSASSVEEAYGPFELQWDNRAGRAYAVTSSYRKAIRIDKVYDLV